MNSSATMILCILGIAFFFSLTLLASSIRIVREEKRLTVYRMGRYIGDKGPGLVLLLPLLDKGVEKDYAPGAAFASASTGPFPSYKSLLLGQPGVAKTPVFHNGKIVLENNEILDAISASPIAEGQQVRVVRVIVEVRND